MKKPRPLDHFMVGCEIFDEDNGLLETFVLPPISSLNMKLEIKDTRAMIERGKTQGRSIWVEKNEALLERYEAILALKEGKTHHKAGKKGREYVGEERNSAKRQALLDAGLSLFGTDPGYWSFNFPLFHGRYSSISPLSSVALPSPKTGIASPKKVGLGDLPIAHPSL